MALIRTFIAIEIPEKIRHQIAELQAGLKEQGGKITWVKPENMHLTLKFLGDTEESLIDTIAGRLAEIVSTFAQFEICIKGVGAFPNLRKPRVFWVGTTDEKDTLKSLANQINQQLSILGFEQEKRPFSAHLTLGRVRDNRWIEPVVKKIEQADNFEAGKFFASEILFIKSELTKQGPNYTLLKRIKIK